MYDALVVGGGPAGLAAATWLARHRRRTLVVDSTEYRNRWVEVTHGYLTRDAAPPAALRAAARADLGGYPYVEVREGRVTELRRTDGWFVAVVDGEEVRALRVVLATGVADAFPDVEGFFEHYGASVFHCPTCDGYDARDKHVVVFGWREHVAGFALTLLDWAAAVTVLTDGRELEVDDRCRAALRDHGVRVVADPAVRLVGRRGDLRAVELASGARIECELAFFSVAHAPRNALAVGLGAELAEGGCLAVNEDNETTVPGLYAAGDLTPGMHLVQVAAAKGAVAGIAAATSLRGEPGAPGSPEPGPDVEAVLDAD